MRSAKLPRLRHKMRCHKSAQNYATGAASLAGSDQLAQKPHEERACDETNNHCGPKVADIDDVPEVFDVISQRHLGPQSSWLKPVTNGIGKQETEDYSGKSNAFRFWGWCVFHRKSGFDWFSAFLTGGPMCIFLIFSSLQHTASKQGQFWRGNYMAALSAFDSCSRLKVNMLPHRYRELGNILP